MEDNLNRFIEAQNNVYEQVVAELRQGRKTSHWMQDYNQSRPHDSLGGMPPKEYRKQHEMKNRINTLAV